MADAKVIPFDDDRDRSRGAGASAASSKRSPGDGGRTGRTGRRPGLTPLPGRRQEGTEGTVGAGGAEAAEDSAGPQGRDESEESGAGSGSGRAAGEGGAAQAGGLLERVLGTDWETRAARGLDFLRRRVTGEYEVDDFGYDQELTDQVLMTLLRPVFEKYFRVEVRGVENIPADGAALVVANHSGTLPLDGLMLQVAVHDQHPADRHLRLLGADLVFVLPLVNELARKAGHTLACAEDAQTLLERGEVVGVMPEGFKGLGKPFADRYKLQRFGRGGFVSTALRAGAPIVPCSIVGAEEIYPMVGNSRTLARLFGFPYFPLTPTFPWLGPLGAVPLPTKWTIQFGEPVPTDGYPPEAAEDPMLMFNLTDQVRETIQHTLYKLLVRRRSVFF
ncbi:lysophospholipid acyltransferase family protein [Streptomyces sp. 891-h]|uniref:lysophospholipid acyltransferase family protein n=1 Tax=unclassified Streptomyces TaxID=2593676 RepID=UPI001FAABD28|nr:lysophospholipid acyltransferase family protein [Streptomyces sp. 891-h]UNZ17926.1 acyltransferase family protein [Streptomyces sp. 891-h]